VQVCISSLVSFASAGYIKQSTQPKTLVILDSWATIETHSVMLRHLEDTLGHHVHYEMADKKIRFREHEQWLWDNVILMAPSIKGK
jgi:uncharacterized protein (DUF486 family)